MMVNRYHSFLRIAMMVTAFALVFDSGILFPVTKQLSDVTISYVASVGASMNASVPENEINALSAQIAEKQRELDAREALLNEREISSRSFGASESNTDYSTYIISVILFILTVLMVLNYAMDWVRVRQLRYAK
jgi:cell shape-determining protein MreC